MMPSLRCRVSKIGSQTWLASDLRFHVPGDTISVNGLGSSVRLYTWQQALNGETPADGAVIRGVCPEGWHLPNSTEWKTLLSTVAGLWWAKTNSALKFGDTPHNPSFGNNRTGFSASPTAAATETGAIMDLNSLEYFYWLSDGGAQAGSLGVITDPEDYVDPVRLGYNYMYSVRCLK